jgi:hypothetical protein
MANALERHVSRARFDAQDGSTGSRADAEWRTEYQQLSFRQRVLPCGIVVALRVMRRCRRVSSAESELSEEQKRTNVIRLVFGGDERGFQEFCTCLRTSIPTGVGVVLRGSAVTGVRWKDGAPFDADGPGTSDMDVTLVGGDALKLFRLQGYYLPGVHSRPLSDEEDPAIAPELVPLRERLMGMVGRPVNIQATADLVMFLRGDLLGQPYLTLVARQAE